MQNVNAKMKNLIILCFTLFILSQPAYAHSPLSIKAEYDSVTKTLSVIVYHPVRSPSKHYIKVIEVKKGGAIVAKKEFKIQITRAAQKCDFTTGDIGPGDTLTVEAYCNINGSLEREIWIND